MLTSVGKLDVGDLREKTDRLRSEVDQLVEKYQTKLVDGASIKSLRAYLIQTNDAKLSVVKEYDETKAALDAVDLAQANLLRDLNLIILKHHFFSADVVKQLKLSDDEAKLVSLSNPNAHEIGRLNRAVLASALPKLFAPIKFAHPKNATVTVEPRSYGSMELTITWLMTWQGWDDPNRLAIAMASRMDNPEPFHSADAWDHVPMVNARYQPNLGIVKPDHFTDVSYRALEGNQTYMASIDQLRKSQRAQASGGMPNPLTSAEKKLQELRGEQRSFQAARFGAEMQLIPAIPSAKQGESWLTLMHAVAGLSPEELSNFTGSKEQLANVKEQFLSARKSFLNNDPDGFKTASQQLVKTLKSLGAAAKEKIPNSAYPSEETIARELHFNRSNPFLWTTYISTLAALVLLGATIFDSKRMYQIGYWVLMAAGISLLYGVVLRVMIAGRPPVSNLYETMIWAPATMMVLAFVLDRLYGHPLILFACAAATALCTGFSHMLPIHFGATISPLQPVLATRFWLMVHVLDIVGSYGMFMLAWMIGNVAMVMSFFKRFDQAELHRLATFCYRSIQVGVLMLASGTILGGVWAADSWGRFWGWDPKEIGALVALLGYLALLHARFVGMVRNFGMLAGSIYAFAGVVFAWYGVNMLGAGLHSYGFAEGGEALVFPIVFANIALAVAAQIYNFGVYSKPTRQADGDSARQPGDVPPSNVPTEPALVGN